jgi:hypothetical protein
MEDRRQAIPAGSYRFEATDAGEACAVCGKSLYYDDDKLDGLCDRCKGAIDMTRFMCTAA